MNPFRDWNPWAAATAFFGGVAVIATFMGNIKELHPYFPVTWGGLEAWAEGELGGPVNELSENDLETRLAVYDLQIEGAKNTLFMLELRLKDAPTDALLLGRKSDIQDSLDSSTRLRRTAECELFHRRGRPLIGC